MTAGDRIRAAALALFDRDGVERTSVAAIRARADVSNGSFFHAFPTKDALAADLYLAIVADYHAAFATPLGTERAAPDMIAGLLEAHLDWVAEERPKAKFLFEQARAEWLASVREKQAAENERFAAALDGWRLPAVDAGDLVPMPAAMFIAQLIGPAQILCRAWLSGRSSADPRTHQILLVEAAVRALAR
ncbi:TetR/AcrR family transcriptional regulator [Sphingopyxis sp. 22461]|uniref:TetR/AcrR family transcriptional regulator n=1 Tax=Sphingopyxis sp. 22461 TaxID=3453923 RepID=UPI003F857F24